MSPAEGAARVATSLKKRRPAGIFFAALLLILLYFILFPYPMGREIVARPAWAEPLPTPQSAGSLGYGAVSPFQLGAQFGFVHSDGSASYVGRTQFRVSLAESGFVNFARLSTNWILQDVAGARAFSFSGSGYPLLSPDGSRIFNVKTDLSGIVELDRNGETLWSRDFPGMMTSAAIHGDFLVVGLLDGTLILLNRQGSPVFTDPPGPARIPVILGEAVTSDGSLIASIAGIDPQYVSVLRRQGSTWAPIMRQAVASDFRKEVRVSFSPDGRFLVFEARDGASLLDPRSRRSGLIRLQGGLAGISFPGSGRYAAVAGLDGARADLAIVAPFGVPIVRESFPASQLFLGSIEGQLLMAWDGTLARVEVVAL
jgi:hypothetical protein